MTRPESPDAVVVGAGLSGLTAAREQLRCGLEPLVLEARDRPGGRTCAIESNGVTLDLGGEWVDEAHADIRALAGSLGMRLHRFERRKENARWYVDGAFSSEMPLSGPDAEVHRRMNEALIETAADVDPGEPWRAAPDHDPSVADWLRREGMSEGGIHAVETLASSCGSTVPLERMSFYSYAVKVGTRGGPGRGNEYRVEGGAGGIAAALAKELGEKVRYSSPVTAIHQKNGGVEVYWMDEEGPGMVRAGQVILAVPFTCHRFIHFDPEPPPVMRAMISNSIYGVARKTFFLFDEAVDDAAFTVTDTPLGYVSAAQDPGATRGSRGIVSFAGGRPLLPELGHRTEERKHRAVGLLRELHDVPEPVSVVEKVWSEEHFTRGSYMIMGPGDMRSFGEMMGGAFGAVHLAGAEGCAAAPSFMNSAVKSGMRAAREVLAAGKGHPGSGRQTYHAARVSAAGRGTGG